METREGTKSGRWMVITLLGGHSQVGQFWQIEAQSDPGEGRGGDCSEDGANECPGYDAFIEEVSNTHQRKLEEKSKAYLETPCNRTSPDRSRGTSGRAQLGRFGSPPPAGRARSDRQASRSIELKSVLSLLPWCRAPRTRERTLQLAQARRPERSKYLLHWAHGLQLSPSSPCPPFESYPAHARSCLSAGPRTTFSARPIDCLVLVVARPVQTCTIQGCHASKIFRKVEAGDEGLSRRLT